MGDCQQNVSLFCFFVSEFSQGPTEVAAEFPFFEFDRFTVQKKQREENYRAGQRG